MVGQNAVSSHFDEPETTAQFELGSRMKGDAGKEYVYVQADGAVTGAGYVVTITEAFQASMITTSNDAGGDAVGVPEAAFADNEYGWVQIYGACNVRVAASAAANAGLNTTATAGQLDDDGTGGSFDIDGLILTTANGGSAATAAGFANYPKQALAAN